MIKFTLIITSTFLSVTASFAQSIDTIEEIQVTATRRPVAVGEVSAAITIVSAEDIQKAKLLTDALAAQPGVFLQQTTPGQGAAIVRGLKGSEILHIVDGFRLNNAIFRNAPTQYLALVAPGSAQRIEIVRGAPTSLYGSDAVGGVLQVVSRMPSFDARGSHKNVYLAYDSADLGKVIRASYEAGDEHLAGLISGEYLQTGNRKIGGGVRVAPSNYESKGARLALKAVPSAESLWLLDFQFATQPATPRVDELVPGFGQAEPSSSEFLFAPNERTFAHLQNKRTNWLWSADWNFALGWQQVRDDRTTRDFGSTVRRFEQNSSDLFGLTVNATNAAEWGSWVAGAEFYYDEVRSHRQEEELSLGLLVEVAARFPDRSSMQQAAVYGNVQYDLADRHAISAGVRFSAIAVDIPDIGIIPKTSVDQSDISIDFGWVFDLADTTQWVANIGYGFRAPNVFDLGTLGERPGNRFNVPNPDLESERITQVDVGIRHRGRDWSVEATAFILHYTDRISSVLTGAVTPAGRDVVQSRNVESADIFGLEFAYRYYWTEFIDVDVVLNYQRGKQDEGDGLSVPADRMPPINGRVSLLYEWTERLSIEPYFVFAAGQDRLSPRDVRDSRIDPNGTPGWMTTNIAATWQAEETMQFRLAVENLFDKQYRVHGSGIDSVGTNFVVSVDMSF